MKAASKVDDFQQSFREAAREILVELETALLELNENREDGELVDRVFRSLHTIKGSGSMFGFDKLAAFTHNLENAFDEVRNGRYPASPELIDLTLEALDQIRLMLEEGLEGAAQSDPEACSKLLARAQAMMGTADGGQHLAASQPGKSQPVHGPAAQANAAASWQIYFAPGPDLMRCGSDPLLLLRELRQLGGLSARATMDALPPLAEIDPGRCYVAWEMVLHTAVDRDAIRDVFIFVEDACELKIEPVPAAEHPAELDSGADADAIAKALEEKRQSVGRRTYDKPDIAASIRVPAAKLDQFVDLVGELVTVQARLGEVSARRDDPELATISEEIDRLTSSLRDSSMNIRMMPIRGTFERFRRLVHDLARDLGKNVELTIDGADTELDKTVIDQLGDPLMHLIRNSMDHGIESPEARVAKGKSATATVRLAARHAGASVLIEVSDDGRGVNVEAVRNRAIERGLISAEQHLSESEVFKLIFQPGFSTAKQVTDVSGRGVGMDVVQQKVESLRGTIDVFSKAGIGTTITLRLPLTLAIIDGLLVNVGDTHYVLPLANTLECIELTRQEVLNANGNHVVYVRGEVVPYIRLREYFDIRSQSPDIEQVMIVETADGRFGLVVDQVLGECQTVIKNLGRVYKHVQVVSGATILGNGTVALILDPERVVQEALKARQQASRSHGHGLSSGQSREGLHRPAAMGQAGNGKINPAIQTIH